MHSDENYARGSAAAGSLQQQFRSAGGGGGGGIDGKIAGLYDFEETLGSGHFAVVKLARHVFTGEKVAVKVVDKTKLDEVSKAHLFQEVRCMKLVQHPNVVRLYEVIDTQTKLYLILELGDGGDLYDYIMKHETGLTEELARKYFRQILKAIAYCHQLHVVHRDLKPENVVFFEKLGVVKLTDFGFSNKFSPGQKLQTFCGSLAYSAPEILLGDSYDAPAVDIWSLGVILYMLVCGQAPFEKANDSETLTMIMDCKYNVPAQISTSCRKLIASMLVRDPKKRATIDEISTDPWVCECSEENREYLVPLVKREEITDDDHQFIMQKMINGKIATKEVIQQSLEKNKYDHITATYYLLAEIRLRKRREERMGREKAKNAPGDNAQVKLAKPAKPNNTTHTIPAPRNDRTEKRNRKCSIVREEDEEESSIENSGPSNNARASLSKRDSSTEGRQHRSQQKKTTAEATEVAGDKLTNLSVESSVVALKELEIGKPIKTISSIKQNTSLTHRRSKLSKIRTPSCSSSEASDDDTKARSKKKMNKLVGDTPIRFRMHRRDSHDDSSDSQDQAFPPAASQQSHSKGLVSSATTTTNSSNVRQVNEQRQGSHDQQKTHTKSEERKAALFNPRHKKAHIKYAVDKHTQTKVEICCPAENQLLDRIAEVQECEQRHLRSLKAPAAAATAADTKEDSTDEFDLNGNVLSPVEEAVWQSPRQPNYLNVLKKSSTHDPDKPFYDTSGPKSCVRLKKLCNPEIHLPPVVNFS